MPGHCKHGMNLRVEYNVRNFLTKRLVYQEQLSTIIPIFTGFQLMKHAQLHLVRKVFMSDIFEILTHSKLCKQIKTKVKACWSKHFPEAFTRGSDLLIDADVHLPCIRTYQLLPKAINDVITVIMPTVHKANERQKQCREYRHFVLDCR